MDTLIQAAQAAIMAKLDTHDIRDIYYSVSMPKQCRPAALTDKHGPWKKHACDYILASIKTAIAAGETGLESLIYSNHTSYDSTITFRHQLLRAACRAVLERQGKQEIIARFDQEQQEAHKPLSAVVIQKKYDDIIRCKEEAALRQKESLADPAAPQIVPTR